PIRADDHLNFFDGTAGIAPDTDLRVAVTWAANTAIGANRTVGAGTLLRITPISYFPASAADEPKYYPQWQSSQWNPPQAFTGLARPWRPARAPSASITTQASSTSTGCSSPTRRMPAWRIRFTGSI